MEESVGGSGGVGGGRCGWGVRNGAEARGEGASSHTRFSSPHIIPAVGVSYHPALPPPHLFVHIQDPRRGHPWLSAALPPRPRRPPGGMGARDPGLPAQPGAGRGHPLGRVTG